MLLLVFWSISSSLVPVVISVLLCFLSSTVWFVIAPALVSCRPHLSVIAVHLFKFHWSPTTVNGGAVSQPIPENK
jgi:hypothetical protein